MQPNRYCVEKVGLQISGYLASSTLKHRLSPYEELFHFSITPCQNLKDCILKGDGWKWPEASNKLSEAGLSTSIENLASFVASENTNCVIVSPQFEMSTYGCGFNNRILCFKGRIE